MSSGLTTRNVSYQSHYVDIDGAKMHYLDVGKGDPILFLHGMPTSCYLWRNIIPHLSSLGRCIAPDLIGMGKSDKPNINYTIRDHINYIEKFIEKLNLKNITIVMHDWGSVIGFDYAMRHENNCKGLVFYEAYLRPYSADDVSLPLLELYLSFRDQKDIQDLILNSPYFVDKIIPYGLLSSLNEKEMTQYREPFLQPGSGKPLQQYLREIPCGDNKSEADKIIATYSQKLSQSKIPKLMLYSVPGFLTTIETAIWAKENFSNLEIADIGEELHYAQETNPTLIGEMISAWKQAL